MKRPAGTSPGGSDSSWSDHILPVAGLDVLLFDVGIDHGGIQAGVAHELLHLLNRHSVIDGCGGKSMTQDVGGHLQLFNGDPVADMRDFILKGLG